MESVSQSSLKKYRKLRTVDGNFDYDDPSSASLNHSAVEEDKEFKIGNLSIEKAAWILVGFAMVYIANLHSVILPNNWPQNSWKLFLCLSYASFFCFIGAFSYLNYYLRYIKSVKITAKHWKRDAPIAVPLATISGSLAFLFLSIGYLPHYKLWTFLIFPVLFMSFFALISLL